MDNETFEQIALQEHLIDAPQFLKEAQEVSVLINTDTDQPMSVELPDKIVVQVTYSEPGDQGGYGYAYPQTCQGGDGGDSAMCRFL